MEFSGKHYQFVNQIVYPTADFQLTPDDLFVAGCSLMGYKAICYAGPGNKTGKRNIYLVMAIVINLDVMMAKRKMSLNELSQRVGLTTVNLSILKTGKAKGVRFDTLESICNVLDCQPGDILEYKKDD